MLNLLRFTIPLIGFITLSACRPIHSPRSANLGIQNAGGIPNSAKTPGKLCTKSDPDFAGLAYPAKLPKCNRNITMHDKNVVAEIYGIPRENYGNYEFDHFIPLAIGGANSPQNLWPQPLDEAHDKDRLETKLYYKLVGDEISQDDAVAQIKEWRP